MKILWTVNNFMPEIANKFGIKTYHAISWVDALSKKLSIRNDVSLSIVCVRKVNSIVKKEINNVTYYIIPASIKKDWWQDVLADFQPDIIHAYGTEYQHNYLLLRNHQDYPILVSLQGILSEYSKHFYAGLDISTMIRYTRLIDLFKPMGFFSGKRNFEKRGKTEREMLLLAKYAEGRSTWDRVAVKKINPNIEYFFCPRMIRQAFFEKEWNLENVERYSIFVHQGNFPIKGLHYVLEALFLIKKSIPNVHLYIGGYDYFNTKTIKEKLKTTGYIHYLKDLIKEYDLYNNITITGFLDADTLAERLSKTHVAVISSSIENAPNSLAESMIVGVPVCASFVGGNMDMLEHGKQGFLYCYNEPNMLAEYILQIFSSPELSNSFHKNAMEISRKRHDPIVIEKNIMDIYSKIILKHKKKI